LIELLEKYNLRKKIIEDEGFNMNKMIFTLKTIKSYDILGLKQNYQGIFLSIHFPKLVNMLQHIKNL